MNQHNLAVSWRLALQRIRSEEVEYAPGFVVWQLEIELADLIEEALLNKFPDVDE